MAACAVSMLRHLAVCPHLFGWDVEVSRECADMIRVSHKHIPRTTHARAPRFGYRNRLDAYPVHAVTSQSEIVMMIFLPYCLHGTGSRGAVSKVSCGWLNRREQKRSRACSNVLVPHGGPSKLWGTSIFLVGGVLLPCSSPLPLHVSQSFPLVESVLANVPYSYIHHTFFAPRSYQRSLRVMMRKPCRSGMEDYASPQRLTLLAPWRVAGASSLHDRGDLTGTAQPQAPRRRSLLMMGD